MKNCSVLEYGAVPDGVTVCTHQVQAAIDACASAGGGRVTVEGGTFVIGTIWLKSRVELHLAAGAVLAMSTDMDDFPDREYDWFDRRKCPRGNARAVIMIGKAEDVAITGLGTLDCRGSHFIERFTDEKGQVRCRRTEDRLPGRMIFAMSSRNLRFEDFTVREMAGGWGMWVNDCDNVRVSRVCMQCDPDYPNADGVHINCSADVVVSDCVLHTGDDSVIIRANCNTLQSPRVCERVIVKGCVLSSKCQAVRIGWRNDYEIRHCLLSDLIITDSVRGIVIELPDHSSPFDVGEYATVIHHISFSNVTIENCLDRPVYLAVHPENKFGGISDIRFSGLNCTSVLFPTVIGRKDAMPENIFFSDCSFTVSDVYGRPFDIFRNTKNLHFDNVTFHVKDAE